MTSRFCTLASKFFTLEVMTSWKFRSIENPDRLALPHSPWAPILKFLRRHCLQRQVGAYVSLTSPSLPGEIDLLEHGQQQNVPSSLSAIPRYDVISLRLTTSQAALCCWWFSLVFTCRSTTTNLLTKLRNFVAQKSCNKVACLTRQVAQH